MITPLQSDVDKGSEDDLEAHREFERDRRLPRQDPSAVQDVLRENEEDFPLILKHHHLPPARLRLTGRPETSCYTPFTDDRRE